MMIICEHLNGAHFFYPDLYEFNFRISFKLYAYHEPLYTTHHRNQGCR
jgi:hypothetical protein